MRGYSILLTAIVLMIPLVSLVSGEAEVEVVRDWSTDLPGVIMDVAVDDDYVYLACNGSGLIIVSRDTHEIAGHLNTTGLTFGVALKGEYVYLADWEDGLKIVDVSNPGQPELLGVLDTPGFAYKITSSPNSETVFLCDLDGGFAIIDVSNPRAPVETGRYEKLDQATDCKVVGDLAFIVDWEGLHILDISDHGTITELSNLSTPGNAYGIDVAGNYAYIADDHMGLRIIDIRDVNEPMVRGAYLGDNVTVHVDVVDSIAYTANHVGGVSVLDVSSSQSPELIASFDTPGIVRRVLVRDSTLILADGRSGISVLEIQSTEPKETPWVEILLFSSLAILIVSFAFIKRSQGLPVVDDHAGTSNAEHPVTENQPIRVEESIRIPSQGILGAYLAKKGIAAHDREVVTINFIKQAMILDLSANLSPGQRFELYLAMRQLSYLLYPQNEWLRDLFHNERAKLTFDSYFDFPASRNHLLHHLGLPLGLHSHVHLDAQRKEILSTIGNSSPDGNYVILGEPGIGKTALLYQTFDMLMKSRNPAILTGDGIGGYHERNSIQICVDDIPKLDGLRKVISKHNVRGLIVTAREKDWEELPAEFQKRFHRLTLKRFSQTETMSLVHNLLEVASITSEPGAVKLLGEYAEGRPVFVWTLISQLKKAGENHLTVSFIRSSTSRGMLNYLGDILNRKFREKGTYRPGGFHALAMLFFLADHVERRKCNTTYFLQIADKMHEHMNAISTIDTISDPENISGIHHPELKPTHELLLSNLVVQDGFVSFAHDYWADLILGNGENNPFISDIIRIKKQFSDTGVFEEAKRDALSETWELVHARYRHKPTRVKEGILAFADTALSNFTVSEIKAQNINIEQIREIAALYSQLGVGEKVLTKLERASPRPMQKIIEIRDSVVYKSTIG